MAAAAAAAAAGGRKREFSGDKHARSNSEGRREEDFALIIGRRAKTATSTRELSLPLPPSLPSPPVIGFATFAFADCLSLLAAREKTSRFSG